MAQCQSITKEGGRCKKNSLPFSNYCHHHFDKNVGSLLSLISFILGSFISILLMLYVDRNPNLSVVCFDKYHDPSRISCDVTNSGRKEAKDVHITFNYVLPLNTTIISNKSGFGISLVESEVLPDPGRRQDPYSDQEFFKAIKVFYIKIERIPPKDHISFELRTLNPDNIRASKQVIFLRNIEKMRLKEFHDRVIKTNPEESRKWNLSSFISYMMKDDNFYRPKDYNYENGEFTIDYWTDDELFARALTEQLYKIYYPSYKDIFSNECVYNVPVTKTKTSNGNSTVGLYPPYVKTCGYSQIFKMPEDKKDIPPLYLEVPPKYEFELIEEYFDKGIAKGNEGDWESALQFFNEVIKLNPYSSEAYYNRGLAKGELDDHIGAIEDFNKAIEFNSNIAEAYNNRGTEKGFLGDYRGAKEDFNEAIKLKPEYADAYYNRGLANLKLEDKDSACLDLSNAVKLGISQANDDIKHFCQ